MTKKEQVYVPAKKLGKRAANEKYINEQFRLYPEAVLNRVHGDTVRQEKCVDLIAEVVSVKTKKKGK